MVISITYFLKTSFFILDNYFYIVIVSYAKDFSLILHQYLFIYLYALLFCEDFLTDFSLKYGKFGC